MLPKLDHSITRFGGLIDRLLDLSRIQSGILGLEKSKFDLVELMNEVIARLQQDMSSHSIMTIMNIFSRL